MAATAGTAIFQGVNSPRKYIKDLYFSDTVNTKLNWDDGAGASATSLEYWTPPENVYLVDLSVVTGAAQTRLQAARDGIPTGDMLRHAIHLNTLAYRPVCKIPFGRGQRISLTQLA